jgi:hypothetical protein
VCAVDRFLQFGDRRSAGRPARHRIAAVRVVTAKDIVGEFVELVARGERQ